ncbi:MAG: DUF3459 domain-containing protein, partial [Micrococcaceae bacterium]|nr:DUF3459 domain-containing protein [Micrococcaceae bacterium]
PCTPAAPTQGFGPSETAWLPQPAGWERLARSAQDGDPSSTLSMYRRALAARRRLELGAGGLQWLDTCHADGVLAFENSGIDVVLNTTEAPVALPPGEVLLSSGPVPGDVDGVLELAANAAVWLRRTT